MNKKAIMFFAIVGMTLGSFVPLLWGETNLLGGMSILMSMVGGFVGICLGAWLSKRYF